MRLFEGRAVGIATVWAEARSEPFEGQVAVAEVILKRADTGYSSDGTIEGTVLRPKQFSCWNESTPWRSKILALDFDDPWVQRAADAWDAAAAGSEFSKGAVLYHTIQAPKGVKSWPPYWAKAKSVIETVRIGGHVFYAVRG